MSPVDHWVGTELIALRAAGLYRARRLVTGGRGVNQEVDGVHYVNFCSNDYLGLASDPRLAAAAYRALTLFGTGSGAAPLVSGYNVEHARLEEELADFLRCPRVLLFSSGWAANLGVLRAVLGRGDLLLADELNHASLIDGGRLSRADYRRVAHCNVKAFADALAAETDDSRRALVVSDSVFSMDGDLADLPGLSRVANDFGATVMIDDAHGFGVLGERGAGAPEYWFSQERTASSTSFFPDIYVATLGKALGVSGAFVAGSESLIEYLIQRARTWVFSTAPPPALAAATRAALNIVRTEPERRRFLFDRVQRFREGAAAMGLPLSASATPIQPLILGDPQRAVALSGFLLDRGYMVVAIRPPTVPPGTCRLRITLTAAHTDAQIDGLITALSDGLRSLRGAA